MRPDVNYELLETTTGNLSAGQDGESLLIVTVKDTYKNSVTNSLFYSLKDAESAGITLAKDLSEDNLLWEHVKDFYSFTQNEGVPLHLLLLGADTTYSMMSTVGDSAYAVVLEKIVSIAKIKMIGVALNPSYAETHTTAISSDLLASIPKLQVLGDLIVSRKAPAIFVLEGRKFAGVASAATDLRTLDAGYCSVIVSRDKDRRIELQALGYAGAANYANVGLLLGKLASVQVHENVGRIGEPPSYVNDSLNVGSAEFSGGQSFDSVSLDVLYEKGYIYIDYLSDWGYYFVDDSTCANIESSRNNIAWNRVLHKAVRIARAALLSRLKSTQKLNPTTGFLDEIVISDLEQLAKKAVELAMMGVEKEEYEKELSSIDVFIKAEQNLLGRNPVKMRVVVMPKGALRKIDMTIEIGKIAT